MKVGMEMGGYWPSHDRHIDNLVPEMIEMAKLAEEVGLDEIAIGEHHFMDYGATPSPLAFAAYIGAITTRVRLMLSVLLLPVHKMPILAGEVAFVDQAIGGRLDLGVGRGGGPYEFERLAMTTNIDEMREIFDEKLELLHKLFEEKDVHFDGKYESCTKTNIMPPPRQRPHPPMWLSCMRPEAAYHVARKGYNVATTSSRKPLAWSEGMLKAFRDGVAESSGRQGPQKISNLQWAYVAKDDDDKREKQEMGYHKQRQFQGLLMNTCKAPGGIVEGVDIEETPEQVADGLMIGTINEVKEKMLEVKELGFDMLVLKTNIGPNIDDEKAGLERFAEHILPELRDEEEKAALETA
ncbi:LLM class flavin-dependent oxidoreductase [Roseovarius indicus]|uniref:LLM class flavin-dependent oxidoreductase n=1 Tax=Roseovarius indicus TaxID=540747 RepID=UPI0032EE3270